MAQFSIWYADGTSYSDSDGPMSSAPRWGVICCKTFHGDRIVTTYGHDYYTWDEVDCQMQMRDLLGLLDMAREKGLVRSIQGGWQVSIETTEGFMDVVSFVHWIIDDLHLAFSGRTVPRSVFEQIVSHADVCARERLAKQLPLRDKAAMRFSTSALSPPSKEDNARHPRQSLPHHRGVPLGPAV